MSARMAGRLNCWGIVGVAVLAVGLVLVGAGCATRVPTEGVVIREVALDRARTQVRESIAEIERFIRFSVRESLEANYADLELAHASNMAQAVGPEDGAQFMAQYLLGLENTASNEEAKLAELMQMVTGVYTGVLGLERVIEMYQRELELSDEAWDQFVRTEAAALARKAIEEGIAELQARQAAKKAEAAQRASEKAEAERMRKEIEELRRQLEEAAKAEEGTAGTPETPGTEEPGEAAGE